MNSKRIFGAEEAGRIASREIGLIGEAWRMSWSDFDGRWLRDQLDSIANWLDAALDGELLEECTFGTDFHTEHLEELGL